MTFRRVKAIAGLLVLLVLLAATGSAFAQPAQKAGPKDYRSRNFLLHTDLPAAEAGELLEKLERMVKLISGYWGRPCSGTLECFVADDLANWPAGVMPPDAQAKVAAGEGIALMDGMTMGDKFVAKSNVYSAGTHGVVQHEVVHAYCGQTFGRTGPVWYSEGMAEMGQYFHRDDCAVQINPVVLKYLQESEPKTLASIVAPLQPPPDTWHGYAWCWALCHMLANNPNYAQRFRPLGIGILTGKNVSFEQTYGDVAKEISFEYLFLLDHICQGFRVDLCNWDWQKKFYPGTSTKRTVTVRLQAKKGWQPTRLPVKSGHEYSIQATGTWKPNKTTTTDGDGDSDDKGRLAAVLMSDWRLGEPFLLGGNGTFVAPADGNLYLRCNEPWSDLADNAGTLSVRIQYVGRDVEPASPPYKPLAKKTETAKRQPEASERTWIDATGQFRLVATFAGSEGGKVRLRKRDGTVTTIPLSALSKADQDYVKQLR